MPPIEVTEDTDAVAALEKNRLASSAHMTHGGPVDHSHGETPVLRRLWAIMAEPGAPPVAEHIAFELNTRRAAPHVLQRLAIMPAEEADNLVARAQAFGVTAENCRSWLAHVAYPQVL